MRVSYTVCAGKKKQIGLKEFIQGGMSWSQMIYKEMEPCLTSCETENQPWKIVAGLKLVGESQMEIKAENSLYPPAKISQQRVQSITQRDLSVWAGCRWGMSEMWLRLWGLPNHKCLPYFMQSWCTLGFVSVIMQDVKRSDDQAGGGSTAVNLPVSSACVCVCVSQELRDALPSRQTAVRSIFRWMAAEKKDSALSCWSLSCVSERQTVTTCFLLLAVLKSQSNYPLIFLRNYTNKNHKYFITSTE